MIFISVIMLFIQTSFQAEGFKETDLSRVLTTTAMFEAKENAPLYENMPLQYGVVHSEFLKNIMSIHSFICQIKDIDTSDNSAPPQTFITEFGIFKLENIKKLKNLIIQCEEEDESQLPDFSYSEMYDVAFGMDVSMSSLIRRIGGYSENKRLTKDDTDNGNCDQLDSSSILQQSEDEK
ncbi:hypothetical protein SLOPH_460 [Spraguea lophii 42_110]|uniref:Uncharacterized protein n=1 Tax=Spraguea lophii (strain 42_110) TaxID=1358809 RepID=S7XQV0_SPRLO|nr:hypothetical protein SLOPH_460 [Spraguea lophii 42_110]